ncbi:hypothetical protein BC628DRAFT_1505971 [Trametes gibbosa]|nr:hypothetical protein BC628DRAFT_1505971 [Trametes gibbosa]
MQVETQPAPSIAALMASVPQKRKDPPPERSPTPPLLPRAPKRVDSQSETDPGTAQSSIATPTDEYGSGRIICETCGDAIPIRDEATGMFTVKLWDTHRSTCSQSGAQHPPEVPHDAPAVPPDASSQNPAKRRRAKRTEEERIAYLRSDPYVAKFEAYRVLCKSCAKWIRLRPNSTYCSIPWDAHRKSCLAKRVAKNARPIPLDEDVAEFKSDPRIKRFDSERVLCRVCDEWVPIVSENEAGAGELWRQHTAVCQPLAGPGPAPSTSKFNIAINVPPPPKHLLALASSSSLPASASASARPPAAISTSQSQPQSSVPSPSTSTFAAGKEPPSAPAPQQEPRRRNADQRAAALRADPLLGEVEPGRVFCKCCKKWVQLRQDSTYCSYPWLQHRAKCLQRRSKIPERGAELRSGGGDTGVSETSGSPEPEEGRMDVDVADADRERQRAERQRAKAEAAPARLRRLGGGAASASAVPPPSSEGDDDDDEDDDDDAPWDYAEGAVAVAVLPKLADLDSPEGRLAFVGRSIRHLYRVAYERADELTIAALVTYLNATLPPDKHEEFDTAEVTKAAAALHERRLFVVAGDVIRIPP